MKKYDIRERALDFAVRSAKLTNKMLQSRAAIEYGKQLIRASASIGANIEEADGTLSRKDFINKMAIGRREARESRYWLHLIERVGLINDPKDKAELSWLRRESEEILLILSSIINKTRAKSDK